MSLQVLHPDTVRELLKGHVSCIPELAEKDQKARAEIESQECPRCGKTLVPRLPRDPTRVFSRDGGVRYEGYCTDCAVVP